MSRQRRPFPYDRDIFVTVACPAIIQAIPQRAFAWGREGHQIIVMVAGHHMRPQAAPPIQNPKSPIQNLPDNWPRDSLRST